jgi:RNA polymerase sigma factor for flagellar operon FliA
LNIPLASYQHLLGELNGLQVGTLDLEHSTDPDEEALLYLTARPEDDPLFRYLDGEMRDRLAKEIDDLPERERLVMTLYYYEEVTMKDIGLIIGVVRSRVCQLTPPVCCTFVIALPCPQRSKSPKTSQGESL